MTKLPRNLKTRIPSRSRAVKKATRPFVSCSLCGNQFSVLFGVLVGVSRRCTNRYMPNIPLQTNSTSSWIPLIVEYRWKWWFVSKPANLFHPFPNHSQYNTQIATANTSDNQYILITPQDMSHVSIGPTVRVHKMRKSLNMSLSWASTDAIVTGDPERNQHLLSF